MGLISQREDRLLEAVRLFERALKLDPEAAAINKALVSLYLGLERTSEAMTACRKVLAVDPGDYETWFIYGRQLKTQGQLKEARQAFSRGVRCAGLKEHPDILQQLQFELGVLYENAKEYPQAIKAFTAAARILDNPAALLEAGPFDPAEITARGAELYERIGRLAVKARQFDQAVGAFRKAQAKAGDKAGRLSYNLAEVYRAQGKYEQSLRSLDAYLRFQPQGMEAYELKIALLKRLKRQDEIVPALERYVKDDPYNVDLKLLLARQYAAQGRVDKAENLYLTLASRSPSTDVYRGLFHLYTANARQGSNQILEMLDKALTTAAKKENGSAKRAAAAKARLMLVVLRDDPKLVKPLLAAAHQRLRTNERLGYETRYFLAVLAGRAGQLNRAEQFYRRCLDEVTPGNEPAVYSGLLKVLWQGNKYKAIVEICEKGLKQTQATNHILFHLDMARALPYLDRTEEAIIHAKKAVKLAPNDARLITRLRLVSVLAIAEKFDQAEAECKAMLKDFSQPAEIREIRYTLSGVYSSARNYSKAEEELKRILRNHPDDAGAYNDLGYIWADQNKNLKQAEDFIRKAIELDRQQRRTGTSIDADQDRDNAAYLDSLGWVLFRRGQLDAARRELEKASGLPGGDDDPVVWDHLADVYFRLDQPARARAAWRKAVTLYEIEKRRRMDQRYKEIKQKLKLLETDTQP
jgi:tetratricopeptide (TPR) repeat protein